MRQLWSTGREATAFRDAFIVVSGVALYGVYLGFRAYYTLRGMQ
jgi:hypothetical protein